MNHWEHFSSTDNELPGKTHSVLLRIQNFLKSCKYVHSLCNKPALLKQLVMLWASPVLSIIALEAGMQNYQPCRWTHCLTHAEHSAPWETQISSSREKITDFSRMFSGERAAAQQGRAWLCRARLRWPATCLAGTWKLCRVNSSVLVTGYSL